MIFYAYRFASKYLYLLIFPAESSFWILVRMISRMFKFFFWSAMISAKERCFLGSPARPAPPAHAEVVEVMLIEALEVERFLSPPPGGGSQFFPTMGNLNLKRVLPS